MSGSTPQSDHDLLIKIDTKLGDLIKSLETAGIPGQCATNEQRHKSHESRLKILESRFWLGISLVIGGVVTAVMKLVLR